MSNPRTSRTVRFMSQDPAARSRGWLHRRGPSGFTLLEVLIATAVTLLMMVSLAQIFKIIGDSMKQGRAALELNNRLRSVAMRIRADLDNITVLPNPPADAASGLGYLKYYDGALTDYTATSISTELSRFGDVDDILMFTARAGDVWFTGKVPLFVLQGVAPSTTNTDLVSIASQHAEIAMFVEPLVTNIGNPSRNPTTLVTDPADGYQKAVLADQTVTDLPASYRLHYRTLLIRPDLNLASTGVLPNGSAGGVNYLDARPISGLPSPTCDMVTAHQQCDLSIRRIDGFTTPSFIAANSLEDLMDPANRFAHVRIPITGNLSSMPLLALSPKLNIPYMAIEPGSATFSSPPQPLEFQSNFLHPAFTLFGSRTGEDILASDILGFDIKGYDPGVPLIATVGADGFPGTPEDDDGDGSSAATETDELGWAGSDDVVMSPNDPGYATAISAGMATVVGSGEYVDLAWGWKNRGLTSPSNSQGQLSGIATTPSLPGYVFTDAMYKSGLAVQSGAISATNPPTIFQPSYDTWTSRYEGDGTFQAERSGSRGAVTGTGAPLESWRTMTDAGTDGIDNNGSGGVDELAERETSPPFPVKLRGLKISIRMEDPATRQVKQMSVAKEFVTQ